MRTLTILLAGLGLLLAACGGGSGSGAHSATTLTFTPGSTLSGFRLAKNSGSTPGTLILDLYGPAGTAAQGVAFYLTADQTRVAWTKIGAPAGCYSLPAGTFDLGAAPQLFADKVAASDLQVGLFQKTGQAVFADTQPIVSVALALRPGAAPGPVAFQATQGKQAIVLNPDGTSTAVTIDLGSLSAQ